MSWSSIYLRSKEMLSGVNLGIDGLRGVSLQKLMVKRKRPCALWTVSSTDLAAAIVHVEREEGCSACSLGYGAGVKTVTIAVPDYLTMFDPLREAMLQEIQFAGVALVDDAPPEAFLTAYKEALRIGGKNEAKD